MKGVSVDDKIRLLFLYLNLKHNVHNEKEVLTLLFL